MFDEIEKKSEKTNKEASEKKIKNNTNNGWSALAGHMLDDKYLADEEKSTSEKLDDAEKSDAFDFRMQELHDKGRKRGRRYSYVGLISSALIMLIAIIAGYLMFSQVKNLSNAVKEDSAEIEAVVDPDNICNLDYCCLASLRRINRNDYLEYNTRTGCLPGYIMKELECENSLKWCEPGPALSPDCVKAGGEIRSSLVAGEKEKNQVCCLGLKLLAKYNIENDICLAGANSEVCVNCPDGICGEGEDYCNCPEDCEKIVPGADNEEGAGEANGEQNTITDGSILN